MTVRLLLVAIDDAQPLGPQVRAARGVLEWKIVSELAGGYSLRHLRRIHEMSDIPDRHCVHHCTMMTTEAHALELAMGFLFGSTPQMGVPNAFAQPIIPTPNNDAAKAAAAASRLAMARQAGRSSTILEDYGEATAAPPARAATLGAAG